MSNLINATVEKNAIYSRYNPRISGAIRDAVHDSLSRIRDYCQSQEKTKLPTANGVQSSGLTFKAVHHPVDESGFAGEVELQRNTYSMRPMTDMVNQLPAISADMYGIVTSKVKKIRSRYKRKTSGLQRIVNGYSSESAPKDVLKQMIRYNTAQSQSIPEVQEMEELRQIMPFAQSTFMDMLNNKLNGIT